MELADLIPRLRLELGDLGRTFRETPPVDVNGHAQLEVDQIEEGYRVETVVDGAVTELDSETYELDRRAGTLTLLGDPPEAAVTVSGRHHETYLDEDLLIFLETAYGRHTHRRDDEWGEPIRLGDVPPVEIPLIVLLAAIETLWALVTEAAQDIDVRAPDGVGIPVTQRYQQLLQLLAAKQQHYEELASALGVGLHRVEMFTLRRVSRSTNRLVPVYKPQEFDDLDVAERVYPRIDPLV